MERITTRILSGLFFMLFLFTCQADAQEVILLGSGNSMNDLPVGEQNAYTWAKNAFGENAEYLSFNDISANGLPKGTKVIWYHYEDSALLPVSNPLANDAISAFISDGGGILTSGFATNYVLDINITTVAPNETIDKDPAGPDVAWGIRPFNSFVDHPVFKGIPDNSDWVDSNWRGFRTISDSVAGVEAMSWWTGNSYPGTGIAAMPWLVEKTFP